MLVTIATFSLPYEAHIAKVQLDALNIPSFIADEHTINMQWLYSNAMGGVRLQVPIEFAAQAKEIINEPFDIEPISELEIDPELKPAACSYCGGTLGELYAKGKRPAVITWLLLGFPLWPIRQVRKCTACGKTSNNNGVQ